MKSLIRTMLLVGSMMTALGTGLTVYAESHDPIGAAVFNSQGELLLPEGFREWVFIGAPLTPHGLNEGKAGFPEFHHVYINPDAFAVYKKTGVFPDGTVIAKELVLLQAGDFPDGSKLAPSGRGFFAGEFQGMDVMVKDSHRFKSANGWGFFNFGHHAPPYQDASAAAPAENCSGCHVANAGKDMVFKTYYPALR